MVRDALHGASAANFKSAEECQECIELDHFLIDGWKKGHVRLIVVNGEGPHVRRACAQRLRKDCNRTRRSTHVYHARDASRRMEFERGLVKKVPRPLRAMPALSTRTSSADGSAGCA